MSSNLMQQAIKAIREERMLIDEAADHYGVDTNEIICIMLREGLWPPPQWKSEAWRKKPHTTKGTQ